jgi:hypothetical protein
MLIANDDGISRREDKQQAKDHTHNTHIKTVRNRTLTLIEREDDTRSYRIFLVYFSHSITMPCPPKG